MLEVWPFWSGITQYVFALGRILRLSRSFPINLINRPIGVMATKKIPPITIGLIIICRRLPNLNQRLLSRFKDRGNSKAKVKKITPRAPNHSPYSDWGFSQYIAMANIVLAAAIMRPNERSLDRLSIFLILYTSYLLELSMYFLRVTGKHMYVTDYLYPRTYLLRTCLL